MQYSQPTMMATPEANLKASDLTPCLSCKTIVLMLQPGAKAPTRLLQISHKQLEQQHSSRGSLLYNLAVILQKCVGGRNAVH